jgi:hypothetical protein
VRGVRRELQAKMLLTERRIDRRLEVTRQLVTGTDPNYVFPVNGILNEDNPLSRLSNGNSVSPNDINNENHTIDSKIVELQPGRIPALPRLEILAERLKLDTFEKKMVNIR